MSEHDSLIERLQAEASELDGADVELCGDAALIGEAAAALSSLAAERDALIHDIERHISIASAECQRAESAEARVLEVERVLGELVAACDTLNEVNGRQMVDRHSQEAARALLKERDDG